MFWLHEPYKELKLHSAFHHPWKNQDANGNYMNPIRNWNSFSSKALVVSSKKLLHEPYKELKQDSDACVHSACDQLHEPYKELKLN